jgi:glycosyltransferase involved in cell wall biosynthesis
MRILEMSDMYPPNLGGTEQHVQTLSRWMSTNGHQVQVAALYRPDLPQTETDEFGVTVNRLKGWGTTLNRFLADPTQTYHLTTPDPGVKKELRRLIRRFRPDVIHAHGWIAQSLQGISGTAKSAYDAKGEPRPVTLCTMHDNSMTCVRKILTTPAGEPCPGRSISNCLSCASATYGLAKGTVHTAGLFSFGSVMAGLDQAIAVSNFVKERNNEYVTATGAPDIRVISSFVKGEILAAGKGPRPERPSFLPEGPYALCVGVVAEHKGIPTLLEAWRSHNPGIQLVLIGPDRRANKEPFPDGVHFVGAMSNTEVLAAWAHATVGIVPSICPDSFPTVTMEAMAFDVPVVASRIGGLVDQITDGENGFLVTPGSAQELGSAIRRLADDPALQTRIGQAGFRSVQRFDVSVVGEQLLTCFRETTDRVRGNVRPLTKV